MAKQPRTVLDPTAVVFLTICPRLTPRDVGGWQNSQRMGIAAVVAYDVIEQDWFDFTADNLSLFYELLDEADILVGFNLHGFIYPILRKAFDPGSDRFRNWFAKSYDLQQVVRMESGFLLSLGSLLKANRLPLPQCRPVDILAMAWRRGKRQAVIDELKQNVLGMVHLYNYVAKRGALAYETSKGETGTVVLQTPTDMLNGKD